MAKWEVDDSGNIHIICSNCGAIMPIAIHDIDGREIKNVMDLLVTDLDAVIEVEKREAHKVKLPMSGLTVELKI